MHAQSEEYGLLGHYAGREGTARYRQLSPSVSDRSHMNQFAAFDRIDYRHSDFSSDRAGHRRQDHIEECVPDLSFERYELWSSRDVER